MKAYRALIRDPERGTVLIWETSESRAREAARQYLSDTNGDEEDETRMAYLESCKPVDIPRDPRRFVEWLTRHGR